MLKIKLFVDIQNDFVTGAFKSPVAQSRLPGIIKFMETEEDPEVTVLNIATKRTNEEDYLETLEGKSFPIPYCMVGTEGHKLCSEFESALVATQYHRVFLTYTYGSLLVPAEIDVFRYEYGMDDEDMEIEICGFDAARDILSHAVILRNYFPEVPITVYMNLCAGSPNVKKDLRLHFADSLRAIGINATVLYDYGA
jgi:hypothetical protein